jgi:hypothetical protein
MDRSPTEPFYEPFPRGSGPPPKGPDPIHVLAYRGAVTGADAYRSVRSAVRLEGDLLRAGNRFVSVKQYREIGFIAVGHAALSSALGLCDALGDHLTQGLVVGPDPVPPEVPFRSLPASLGWPGDSRDDSASAAVLELAQGLGERDLLVVVLSPGALPVLATPPAGWGGPAWASWLRDTASRGATGPEISQLARLTGTGAAAGRLAVAAGGATLVTLLVDRGDGPAGVGGGPTILPTDSEQRSSRATLERLGLWSKLPPPVSAAFAPAAGRTSTIGPNVRRPVVVATPADALRGAADTVGERKYMPRLAALSIPDPPEIAAELFLSRVEAVASENREAMVETDRKGIVAFAALTLGLPEGVDDQPAFDRFLSAVQARILRREMSVSLMRTSGASDGSPLPPGAVVGGIPHRGAPLGGGARALRMRSGITDVGLIAVALIPAAPAP